MPQRLNIDLSRSSAEIDEYDLFCLQGKSKNHVIYISNLFIV